jgi:hypothetical protein
MSENGRPSGPSFLTLRRNTFVYQLGLLDSFDTQAIENIGGGHFAEVHRSAKTFRYGSQTDRGGKGLMTGAPDPDGRPIHLHAHARSSPL